MVRGAFTSIPFLALKPETATIAGNRLWMFCYDGVNFRRANVTRYALGLQNIGSIGQNYGKEPRDIDDITVLEEEMRRKEFRARIYAEDMCDFTPLPRDFFDEERRRIAAERREAKIEERRKKDGKDNTRSERRVIMTD